KFSEEDGVRCAVLCGENLNLVPEVDAHDAAGPCRVGQADPGHRPAADWAGAIFGARPAEDVGLVDAAGVATIVAAGPAAAGPREERGGVMARVGRAAQDLELHAAGGAPLAIAVLHVFVDAQRDLVVQGLFLDEGQDQDDPVGAKIALATAEIDVRAADAGAH